MSCPTCGRRPSERWAPFQGAPVQDRSRTLDLHPGAVLGWAVLYHYLAPDGGRGRLLY